MIEAGKLRHRVIIQTATEARDSYGQPIQTWATFDEVWAEILPLRGTELFTAQQVQSKVVSKIKIRYLAGVSPKMRVLFGARIYQIESIINTTERNVESVLMCSEVLT
jgi:SPP1 family predicted phage head-tail adaptor